MADLTRIDWGRIYAYMEKSKRESGLDLLDAMEKDPMATVTDITAALGIPYTAGKDIICEIIDPPISAGNKADIYQYRTGTKKARLTLRLAC